MLFKPTVYAQLVREKFEDKVKVAKLADNLGFLQNTTVGETVSFPKWKTISDAEDVTKGTAVGIEALDQEDSTATIKMVAPKGVRVYDIDNMTALGNAIEEAASQQATTIARKVDLDLIQEALTSPLKYACTNAKEIDELSINNALGLYGDEQDVEDFAGIVINSLLLPSFIFMGGFTSVEKTYTAAGNGIVHGGLVGYFRGIPVFMANHGTYDSVHQECITLIIKKHSLGIMPKRNISVEEDRQPALFATDVYSNMVYAVKLIADDGVVVIKKTI